MMLGFAVSLMSMLALQNAMITQFSENSIRFIEIEGYQYIILIT
jgi:hypothetical protein